MSVGDELLTLVGKATADDLKAVDEAIAAKEREIDSLRAVRKVIALATGAESAQGRKKPQAARSDSPAGGANGNPNRTVSDERREKIAKYLYANGKTGSAALCRVLSIPTGSITATLAHPWFVTGSDGISLSELGRKAAPGIAV